MLRRWAHSAFAIDPRSLALFRCTLGVCAAWDVVDRVLLGDHRLLLLNDGVRLEELPPLWPPSWEGACCGSLYDLRESVWITAVGVLHVLCAMCLAVGTCPHMAAAFTWILHASLLRVDQDQVIGADYLLLQLLLWASLIPHHEVDSGRVLTWGTVGLCCVIPLVNLDSGLQKLAYGKEWHLFDWRPVPVQGAPLVRHDNFPHADAVSLVLCSPSILKEAGLWLRGPALRWPLVGRLLTAFTLIVETIAPLLYFAAPSHGGRVAAFLVFLALQVGLWAVMDLRLFMPAMMIGLLPHLPSRLWDSSGRTGGMIAACIMPEGTAARGQRHRLPLSWMLEPFSFVLFVLILSRHYTFTACLACLSTGDVALAAAAARANMERRDAEQFSCCGPGAEGFVSQRRALDRLEAHATRSAAVLHVGHRWNMFESDIASTTAWPQMTGTTQDGQSLDLATSLKYNILVDERTAEAVVADPWRWAKHVSDYNQDALLGSMQWWLAWTRRGDNKGFQRNVTRLMCNTWNDEAVRPWANQLNLRLQSVRVRWWIARVTRISGGVCAYATAEERGHRFDGDCPTDQQHANCPRT